MKCNTCSAILPNHYKVCPVCGGLNFKKEEFVQIIEDKDEEISVHVAQGEFKFEELE